MHSKLRAHLVWRLITCWNWKCGLISASMRSAVYLAAMVRSGAHGRLAIVLVEIAYVTLTAGTFAGMQQKALDVRPRIFGDLIVVLGVPGLAQWVDWLAHRVTGSVAPDRATVAVCVFTVLSAWFHLHVMRRGALLTGERGVSLREDLRRIPGLALSFVTAPFAALRGPEQELQEAFDREAA